MNEIDDGIRIVALEEAVSAIVARNKRVELEKAWEQSHVRIFSILLITYLFMCLVFYLVGNANFFTNALIPTFAYFLSTLSLSLIKQCWMKKQKSDE